MEDTKLLVSGAGASQEKLAQAAQSSVSTITKLADVVKLGAASLGSEDPETQVCARALITLQACRPSLMNADIISHTLAGTRLYGGMRGHFLLLPAGGPHQCSEGRRQSSGQPDQHHQGGGREALR